MTDSLVCGRNDRESSGNANCTSCAVVRELPAAALWRHGTGCFVLDRRTGPTGTRGYLVRQRRLADQSHAAGPLRASFASRYPMQRSATLSLYIAVSLGASR